MEAVFDVTIGDLTRRVLAGSAIQAAMVAMSIGEWPSGRPPSAICVVEMCDPAVDPEGLLGPWRVRVQATIEGNDWIQ